jgi:5'-nucleotidase (lipoprotein e(P4) family)
MRRAIPLLLFALAACVTTTDSKPAPVAAIAAPPPCDPGLSLLNATLWVQTSAEYRAAALQTFSAAQRGLDAALAKADDDPHPPAIILDLDETVLDNTGFEARAIRAHTTYDSKLWKAWTAEAAALAVPGATEFLVWAKSKGVTPFYITNRDLDEEPGTRRNLEQLGFPFDPNVDTLLMKGENGWTTSDKSPRRAYVANSYRVLLVLGDDLNDFVSASDKTLAERAALVDSVRSRWGQTWFIVPNPMYGSWERAAVTSGGSPCEQMQKKVDALR